MNTEHSHGAGPRVSSVPSIGAKIVSVPGRTAATLIVASVLHLGVAFGQDIPPSPARPWYGGGTLKAGSRTGLPTPAMDIDTTKTYSLSELIDLAESHNPRARVAWERARAQLAQLGIARSELYPTLAAVAVSRVDRG